MGDRCPKRADAMKRLALPLVFAVFLTLAPVVRADDGSILDSFHELIDQLVTLVLGDEPALKELDSPSGDVNGKSGVQSEIGELFPPFG
jgi:hypothetical protein